MKKIAFLIIMSLFISCKSYKVEYKFANSYLNYKIDSILNFPFLEKDTFYLINNPIDKDHVLCRASFKEFDSIKKLIPLNKVIWKDSKRKINEQEINEIRLEISRFKQEKFIWDCDRINLRHKIISLDQEFITYHQESKINIENKATRIIFMSKPFFNKKRDVCLFLIATSSTYKYDSYSEKTFIFKKEMGNWILVGEVF